MIYLYQGPRAWGQPNLSPFCTKIELFLRLARLDYETREWTPFKAPKGKMPYIALDDQLVADSSLIIDFLVKKYGLTLDDHLSDASHATGHIVKRMLEEATYFCGVNIRWKRDENFAKVKKAIFENFPLPLRLIAPAVTRRKVLASLQGQGVGRHSMEEVVEFAKQDFEALKTIIGNNEFLLGSTISSYDCTVFAWIDSLLMAPMHSEVSAIYKDDNVLRPYHERIRSKYFSDIK